MQFSALAGLAVCVALLLWTIRYYERTTDELRAENGRLRIAAARADESRSAVIEAYEAARERHPSHSRGLRVVDGGWR